MTARTDVSPIALNKEQSAQYLSLGISTFEKLVREDKMPKPRQLSEHRVAWVRAELDAWLQSRPPSDLPPPPNTGASKRRQIPAPPGAD